MKQLLDEYVVFETYEDVKDILLNGKPIDISKGFPLYYKIGFYHFYDKDFPIWNEVTSEEYHRAIFEYNKRGLI